MSLLSLLAAAVYAAETVISPLPQDDVQLAAPEIKSPQVSFGLLAYVPPAAVAGATTTPPPAGGPTPTPPSPHTRKSHFTISVLGDSMVDTLGPGIPALASLLKSSYPGVTFSLLNYGVGATNIDHGLKRLISDYDYLGNHIPSLLSQHPDIVVVESFGYNPYSDPVGGLNKQWLTLSAIVDTIHQKLPGTKVIIAATIAPNANVFGDGAPGVSLDSQGKREHVTIVKQYLENALRFASGEHLPIADAYHPSLTRDGNGSLAYINPGDHIHPSGAGRALFAQKVAEAIVGNGLLE